MDEPLFELCNTTWKQIVAKYGKFAKATDYNPREQVMVLVWQVYGIIGYGGFEYLFSGDMPGDPDYQLSLKAFKTIGCKNAACAFEDALAVFANGKIPKDYKKRKAKFMRHPEKKRDEYTIRFYDAENEIITQLADYIRKQTCS